jgi:hypothetical protein
MFTNSFMINNKTTPAEGAEEPVENEGETDAEKTEKTSEEA